MSFNALLSTVKFQTIVSCKESLATVSAISADTKILSKVSKFTKSSYSDDVPVVNVENEDEKWSHEYNESEAHQKSQSLKITVCTNVLKLVFEFCWWSYIYS